MILQYDDAGHPYLDVGRTPPLDDGVRITLVSRPGWDAGGPVLRYRRYKSDGTLYAQGPDLPIRSASDNALAVLTLLSIHERTPGAALPAAVDSWLPLLARRFSGDAGWRFEHPEMNGEVAGYLYGAVAPADVSAARVELADPRLEPALRHLCPYSETHAAELRVLYSGDAVVVRYRDALNCARFSSLGVLEFASPIWKREGRERVAPVRSILGDAYVMIEQAAYFYRALGVDQPLVFHARLVNLGGWGFPSSVRPIEPREPTPLANANIDIGPLVAGKTPDERRECFRTFANRLFNQFGLARCVLVDDSGRLLESSGAPASLRNLPPSE